MKKKFRVRLIVISVSAIILTAISLIIIGFIQNKAFFEIAGMEIEESVNHNLDNTIAGVTNLIAAQDETVREQLSHNLSVAHHLMYENGGAELDNTSKIRWTAINQYTQENNLVLLPGMRINGNWVAKIDNQKTRSEYVDQIQELVGGVATVFIRMNEDGDMLRYATNVLNEDGSRAIGTYIPATNPDGQPNPVISNILKGETFYGNAFVVNKWYMTAYEPIFDSNGEIIGTLFVGIEKENLEGIRQGIANTDFGETGMIFILEGSGEDKGKFIISPYQELENLVLWEMQDDNGNFFIRDIINQATQLQPGEFGSTEFFMAYEEGQSPTEKISHFAYYEPWDWVIGASIDKEEAFEYEELMQDAQIMMNVFFLIAGLVIASISGFILSRWAKRISRPIETITKASNQLADEEIPQLLASMEAAANHDLTNSFKMQTSILNVKREDEIGQMAEAFNRVNLQLNKVSEAYNQMTKQLCEMISKINSEADQVNNTSIDLSQTAHESDLLTTQVAQTLHQVAEGSNQQANDAYKTSESVSQMVMAIQGIANGAKDQAEAIQKASVITNEIAQSIQQVAENTNAAKNGAKIASDLAENGSITVEEAIARMEAIQTQVTSSSQKVLEMGERSSQIGDIAETIEDIAAQTNLLSLNAAIEAARAGVHGKGFAVVADSIRKLAERSTHATQEITKLVKDVQITIKEAVEGMEASSSEVDAGVIKAGEARQALSEIIDAVEAAMQQSEKAAQAANSVSDASSNLVAAVDSVAAVVEENIATTEQMAANANEVDQATSDIASVSEENNAAIEELTQSGNEMSDQALRVSESAEELTKMANQLKDLVSRFKID
jgi:methyl-accepting chemotaxis protein